MVPDQAGERGDSDRPLDSRSNKGRLGGCEPASSVQQLLNAYRPGAFDRMVEFMIDLLDVSTAYITLVDEHRFYLLAARGMNCFVFRRTQLPDDELIRRRTPYLTSNLVPDPRMGPRRESRDERDGMRWLGVPVIDSPRRVLGTVSVRSFTRGDWSQADFRCLSTVADDVVQKLASPPGPVSSPE